ncbi:MAG: FtsQ-type POTRA domain-containing protein [Ornithinimicrobium sp.]
MDKRFSDRLRRVRRRGVRPVLVLLTALMLVVATVYLVGFSPVLAVKEVAVSGAPEGVSRMAIQNAEAPMGRPLARVDTSAIAERVSTDTRIEEVEVSRSWPSTITLELSVRTPVAVLTQSGQQPDLIDAQGVAYEEVGSAPSGLPKVSAPAGDISRSSLLGVLDARAAIEEPWDEEVTAMAITADGDIRFRVGAIRVQWGPPNRAEAKAAALGALLEQEPIDPDGDANMTIDLTAPGTPVVTGLPTVP